jgi:hypothetical protein
MNAGDAIEANSPAEMEAAGYLVSIGKAQLVIEVEAEEEPSPTPDPSPFSTSENGEGDTLTPAPSPDRRGEKDDEE